MANFTFDNTIPAANNNPSSDQPIMLTNNVASQGIITVDHIGYNANNGGTHLQVTFIEVPDIAPPVPTGEQSVIYSSFGTINTTTAQGVFQNSQGIFPINLIRAFGSIPLLNGNGSTNMTTYYNATTAVTVTGGGTIYAITLTTGIVTGNNICVLMTPSADITLSYTFTNPTLTITQAGGGSGTTVNFAVLQF